MATTWETGTSTSREPSAGFVTVRAKRFWPASSSNVHTHVPRRRCNRGATASGAPAGTPATSQSPARVTRPPWAPSGSSSNSAVGNSRWATRHSRVAEANS